MLNTQRTDIYLTIRVILAWLCETESLSVCGVDQMGCTCSQGWPHTVKGKATRSALLCACFRPSYWSLHTSDCSPVTGVERHLCSHFYGNCEEARKIMHGEMYISTLTSLLPIQPSSFPWEQEFKDLQRLQLSECHKLRAANDSF